MNYSSNKSISTHSARKSLEYYFYCFQRVAERDSLPLKPSSKQYLEQFSKAEEGADFFPLRFAISQSLNLISILFQQQLGTDLFFLLMFESVTSQQ